MLVGRPSEREQIDALLASAAAGEGAALVVRGEPGIGKSALLGYAAERAGTLGMRTAHAHGVEAEAELAFSGLQELLRPMLDLLDEIPERQADALRGAFGLGPPVDARLLINSGTLSLLAAAAGERPLVCLVDDAHWLDAASADALVFAARRLEADAVTVLFAARDGEERTFDPPGIPELALDALGREDAVELLRDSGLPDSVVADLHRAAAGNPLALLELPAALTDEQRAGSEPLPEPLPVTKALREAYARRIAALPDETQRALLVAAAEPSGDLGLIERACKDLGADVGALAAAEDAELVAIVDARVVFHHPLVSGAAYYDASPTERRRIHAALADAVGEGEHSRQAWHLAEAAAGPDERVAAALEEAARTAYARSGYRSAAVMLERAAALTPPGPKRAERLYFAAILHFYGHSIARALALLADAEEAARTDAEQARIRLLRLALWYYRDPQQAATLLVAEAQRLAAGDAQAAALAAALAACFRAHMRDADGALEAAQLTREYAGGSDRGDNFFAGVGAGNGFIAAGKPGEAGPLREQAAKVFQAREWRYDHPEDWVRGYSGLYAGATLILLGEHEALRSRIESLAAEFVPGDEVSLMLARGLLGTADYLGGRWAEARARISESLRLAHEMGWLGPQVHGYARVLAQLAAAQGAEDEARAQQRASAPYAHVEWAGFVGTGALGLLALGRGEYAEASARYDADVMPRVSALVLYHDVADAIEAYLHADRIDDAERWFALFDAQARESGWDWAVARAAHLGALLPGSGDRDALFEAAFDAHERARQPFLRARTELAFGDYLRREGRRRDAREPLRAALATFDALGAAPWAENAATQLRTTGEQVRRSRDRDTSKLTPQELQVALVVARGATNKEAAAQLFLSPKTIEKHLGSTYTKLGLRSRAELARLFTEQEREVVASAGAA
jgi:DNA-binding CsgD family transcriptional regulator